MGETKLSDKGIVEILKLESFEIPGNSYFSIHFCIFNVFKEGSQVAQQGAPLLIFEMWRGTWPLCRDVNKWFNLGGRRRKKFQL